MKIIICSFPRIVTQIDLSEVFLMLIKVNISDTSVQSIFYIAFPFENVVPH